MVIEIGGAAVGFRVDDARLRASLAERYRLFLSKKPPELTLSVEILQPGKSKQPRPFSPTVEARGTRLAFKRGDGSCELDWSACEGVLRVWPNPWSFDAAARIVYSRLLAKRRAFFVHAAAISDGTSTVLFPGPSGAGKTTLAAACRALRPLGDELVLVRRDRAGFSVVATPFWGNGRIAEWNGEGRIDAVAFLERRNEPSVRRLGAAEAVRRASRCLVWFGGPSKELADVWGELAELVMTSPALALSFKKRTSPWKGLLERIHEN